MSHKIADDLKALATPLENLDSMPGNPRRGDVDAVAKSYDTFGQRKPIVARKEENGRGTVLAGNHQLAAARKLGWTEIAVVWVADDDTTAKAFALADNRTAELGSYDEDALAEMIRAVQEENATLLKATGWDPLDDLEDSTEKDPAPSLADRFVVPPFTVLDARSGQWAERKAHWLSVGIQSEKGRDEGLLIAAASGNDPTFYTQKTAVEKKLGRPISTAEFEKNHYVKSDSASGTSVFDPVLCELAYRWFSPTGGSVLDPFAGGSVRGVVAALLGRAYTGIDLRGEQISANIEQWKEIAERLDADPKGNPTPTWHAGDSNVVLDRVSGPFDLVFSCPPYADLEVYSDDPADISNMDYDEFLEVYRNIIAKSVDRIKPNGFAVWVIGEVRDKKGLYRGFVPDTIRAFEDAGARLYNEAVLVTQLGSLPIRAGRQFSASRKLGKTHQNVLVFFKEAQQPTVANRKLERQHHTVLVFSKGDPKAAVDALGEVNVDDALDLASQFGEVLPEDGS